MSSNIVLGPGSSVINCLIVRLDDSEYMVSFTDDAGDATLGSSIMYVSVPSAWQWAKLWWKTLRHYRPQKNVTAGIYVPEKLVVREPPVDIWPSAKVQT